MQNVKTKFNYDKFFSLTSFVKFNKQLIKIQNKQTVSSHSEVFLPNISWQFSAASANLFLWSRCDKYWRPTSCEKFFILSFFSYKFILRFIIMNFKTLLMYRITTIRNKGKSNIIFKNKWKFLSTTYFNLQ